MRHVDLCSGIGGFALGFEWAGLSHPVLFCDIEPWSRQVLAKHWPDVPIAEDVKELANDPARLVPDCDILTAGYPCQPFSVAGQQRGAEDDRHIWPEIFAIVQAKRPDWCVFENVSGHITLGLDQVLSDLEGEGYAIQPFVIPACAVNAPHRRDRVWIVAETSSGRPQEHGHGETDDAVQRGKVMADTDNEGSQGEVRGWQTGTQRTPSGHLAKCDSNVADTSSQRQQRQGSSRDASNSTQRGEGQATEFINGGFGDKRQLESRICHLVDGLPKGLDRFDGWEREPADIPRVATGVKDRVSCLKGLGNAIVPQIAMRIGLTIKAVRDE
jgi:DNA (cytosine-5)-methyltransferase 1